MSYATFNSRIYYRNTFLHVGHLQTLYYNNDFAKLHNGLCYAIVDDRQDPARSLQIKEDLDYLGLTHIKVVSVMAHQVPIHLYTRELVESGALYIPCLTASQTLDHLTNPRSNFQIKLNYGESPTIGYSKQLDNGTFCVIYIFDYIIKVLDALMNITDVITTTINDVSDTDIMAFFTSKNSLKYHTLDTYKITGFRYSKKDWPTMPEDDPRLMTIRGLKARHVPPEVIYSFYLNASAVHKHDSSIKITFFDKLLKTYLSLTSPKTFGIIDPLTVELTNIPQCYTEFIFKSGDSTPLPLSRTIFIDKADFGLIDHGSTVSKDKEALLRHTGGAIYISDVEMDHRGIPTKLYAKYYQTHRSEASIHWMSSIAGSEPIRAKFFLYNWFFTGENPSNSYDPVIKDGYIDACVFKDTTQIYQLERHGYFKYDQHLSELHSVACFIKITGYR